MVSTTRRRLNQWSHSGVANSGRRRPPLPRRRSSYDTGHMELTAVRSFRFRRPSAEALTWLVTAALLATGSLLPETNTGMLIAVAQGVLALLPVVAVAAVLAGALTLGNWSDRALSWLSGGPVRAVVIASFDHPGVRSRPFCAAAPLAPVMAFWISSPACCSSPPASSGSPLLCEDAAACSPVPARSPGSCPATQARPPSDARALSNSTAAR